MISVSLVVDQVYGPSQIGVNIQRLLLNIPLASLWASVYKFPILASIQVGVQVASVQVC